MEMLAPVADMSQQGSLYLLAAPVSARLMHHDAKYHGMSYWLALDADMSQPGPRVVHSYQRNDSALWH